MDDKDFRPDARATLAGVVVVIVLLALGLWVFSALDASQRAQSCLESGGRRCAVVEPGTVR